MNGTKMSLPCLCKKITQEVVKNDTVSVFPNRLPYTITVILQLVQTEI